MLLCPILNNYHLLNTSNVSTIVVTVKWVYVRNSHYRLECINDRFAEAVDMYLCTYTFDRKYGF